jgi:aminoglycoside phosphotransferase (APT) family kinase protein
MTIEEQTSSVGKLRLVGQGAEAEVFEWRDGRVLKLLRARGATERLACEVAALEAAHSAGVRVPRAYEQVVVDGRPGLVMQRLEGTDLLSVLGQKPWLVFRSGRLTGEIQAGINEARAPASLPMVRDVMRAALARLARREPGGLADWAERILGRLPDGEALCHGDFHPGQLILSNGQCATLDWAGAKRGDPLFDYARTRVLLSMGETPPGTQLPLRFLVKLGRQLFISSYVQSYERNAPQPVDRARLREWEIVNLAVRVLDNIPGERPRLLQRLQKERSGAQSPQTSPLWPRK